MAISYGFFNSKNGDRKYNAEDIGRYFDKLITSGVYPVPSTNLQVTAAGGMKVNVAIGRAMLDCHWMDNDSAYPLTLAPSDVVLNRIDAIVMRLDLNENIRDIDIIIKKGVNATNPVAPTMTRNDYVKEYCLAHITVNKLTESITQSMIRDTRADTTICGWVTGLITQVDTTTLFLQWEDAYNKYFNQAKSVFETWFTEKTTFYDNWINGKQTEFENWFKTLTEELGIITYIKTYQSNYNATTEMKEIPVNIPAFDIEYDYLQVFIGGVMFVQDVEYQISGTGSSTKIILTNTIKGENDITFIVLKSEIGTKKLLA